jgi:hypothetical protein
MTIHKSNLVVLYFLENPDSKKTSKSSNTFLTIFDAVISLANSNVILHM